MPRKKTSDETLRPVIVAVITSEHSVTKYDVEAWRYYTLLDIFRTVGLERQDAMDAAKWCGRAKDGDRKKIGDVQIEIKTILEKEI